MSEPANPAVDQLQARIRELVVLLDLTADRLFDLQQDFVALHDQLVGCYAALAGMPAVPDDTDIWGTR
jgi:hypothetical protein